MGWLKTNAKISFTSVTLVWLLAIVCLVVLPVQAYYRPQLVSFSAGSADILLLSDRYIKEEDGDQLIGEVINNGTAGAKFVKIIVSYYDAGHSIIGTDFTYADPSDILPGQRSSFLEYVPDNSIIESQLASYEIVVEWQNPDGTSESKRYGPPQMTQPSLTVPQDQKSSNDTTTLSTAEPTSVGTPDSSGSIQPNPDNMSSLIQNEGNQSTLSTANTPNAPMKPKSLFMKIVEPFIAEFEIRNPMLKIGADGMVYNRVVNDSKAKEEELPDSRFAGIQPLAPGQSVLPQIE